MVGDMLRFSSERVARPSIPSGAAESLPVPSLSPKMMANLFEALSTNYIAQLIFEMF